MSTPRDNIKSALKVASSIPIVGEPANAILGIANETGYFDKSAIEKMTDKEMFFDFAFDAIAVNPEKYKELSCTCTKTGKDDDVICWKKGFIGALDRKQVEEYCPVDKRILEVTGITTRIQKFREASIGCELGEEFNNKIISDFTERLKCMHDKLETYNITGVD